MQSASKSSESAPRLELLSEMTDPNKEGLVCVRITSVGDPQVSRSGWKYRRLRIEDNSMSAEMLIAEPKFTEWKFKSGDYAICRVRSNGVSNEGRLSLFFNEFLGPFETSRLLYDLSEAFREIKSRSGEHMKSSETVYQISAREVRSLLELIRLWIQDSKPQHYTKWCQMHQIVATNLFYMGLVKRTGSMSGYYYPTEEALDFFQGKKNLPKKRVFVRNKEGKHEFASEEGESKSFSDYLGDYTDRETALREYAEALNAYKEKIKAS